MPLYGSTWTGQQKNMYLWTAVFELVLGGGFLVGAFVLPAARFGFILTAVILWGVAFPLFFAWNRTRSKAGLETTGVSGTATVAGFTQTGMSMNDQPRVKLDLLVTVPGKPAYHVHQAEFVPIALLGLLTTGATIPVKVDPQNPSKVLLEWEQIGASSAPPVADVQALLQQYAAQLGAAVPAAVATPAPAFAPASPAEDGWKPGRATVLDLQDTGAGSGDTLALRFKLRLSGASAQPYEVDHTESLARNVAGRLVKGQSFPARVDPSDPSNVAVDWAG
jgi:hypothetical protein